MADEKPKLSNESGHGERDETTERELEERLRHLKNRQTSCLSNVTKKRNELIRYMSDWDDIEFAKDAYIQFNDLCDAYISAHEEHMEAITSEDTREEEAARFEKRQLSIVEFRNKVQKWLREGERHSSPTGSHGNVKGKLTGSHVSRSRRTKSRSGRVSTTSSHSIRSAQAREKAKVAEFEASKSVMEKRQQLLKKRQQLDFEEQALDIEAAMARAKAREQVFASMNPNLQTGHDAHYSQHPMSSNVETMTSFPPQQATDADSAAACGDVDKAAAVSVGNPPQAVETGVSTFNVNVPPPTSQHDVITLSPSGGRPHSAFDVSAPSFTPARGASAYTHPVDNVSTVNTLMSALSLPQPDIPKFRGAITEYKTFISAFDARIASRITSYADKLYYLDQHLCDEPKVLIEGCMYMSPECGYEQARALLDKEYGDPYKVSMSYVSELQGWPMIKANDCFSLKKFAVFLSKCESAMASLSYLCVLNDPPSMLSAVRKLPQYLQNKWCEHVGNMRVNSGRVAIFHDLVQFVYRAADTANDPVYGRHVLGQSANESAKYDKTVKRSKSSSFATNVNSSSKCVGVSCKMCNGQHDIGNCKSFLGCTVDERRDFLKQKRLCFACYGSDHISKGCTQKRKCKTCGKSHPTAMHVNDFVPKTVNQKVSSYDQGATNDHASNRDSSESVPVIKTPVTQTLNGSCNVTGVQDSVVLHAILPVQVHQKGSNKVVHTYAFYDNGSSGCFMTEDLYSTLQARGSDTRLQLRTMHGSTCSSSKAVKDIVVRSCDGQNPVELPKVFTRHEIPVSEGQIPKPDVIRKLSHLQHVADHLPAYKSDLKIGLLIGLNCPAALEPLEVAPAKGPGPFATRLRHGWTV